MSDRWVSKCGTIELRQGRWQEVLADVAADCILQDPPYGARTHEVQRHGRKDGRYCDPSKHPILSSRGLGYDAMSVDGVCEFLLSWQSRCRGWICTLTSHDLVDAWSYVAKDRYSFAPIACVQHAMNIRLAGDGPSNWATWLVVSRPRSLRHWGSLPGAYVGASCDVGENALDRSKRPVAGGKPLWLMRALVRDYSRPGDLVVDPFAGGATTLLAAAIEGRRCLGAEQDPVTFAKAVHRLSAGWTVDFTARMAKPKQKALL